MNAIILVFLIYLILLELSKNTILGWVLAFACGIAFLLVHIFFFRKKKWLPKLALFAGYLIALVIIYFVSAPPVLRVPAVDVHDPQITQTYTLAQGDLTGVYNKDQSVEVFAGIPYAKPPVGELRWKAPQPADAWEGTLAADHFGPMSMQPTKSPLVNSLTQIIGYHDFHISLDDNYIPAVSEDSLYLNIWKPAGDLSNAPVLVYIHGGSLQTGQPWYADYSGMGLAEKGIIVVNMAYRLGVYGFYGNEELAAEDPNGSTGNYGLMDQIQALHWVQDNIAAFGGDPSNVTIAGESAGSACISALCTSPQAKGLFVRAIGESSTVTAPDPAHSYRSYEDTLAAGQALLEQQKVTSLKELRNIPAKDLLYATDDNHHITIDGYVLEKDPVDSYAEGQHNESALLHGFNKTESTPFRLFQKVTVDSYKEELQDLYGDYADQVFALYPASTDQEASSQSREVLNADWFTYGHYCWSRQALDNDIPVYEYYFTRENGRLGSWHSGEEVYFYGNIPEKSRLYNDVDRALSAQMSSYFANFIRTGDPNNSAGAPEGSQPSDLPEWPQVNDPGMVYEFGDQVGLTQDPYVPLYEIFDQADSWF